MTADIVDPQFPQIMKVLEPGYMQGALQKALYGDDNLRLPVVKIESCRIGEKRYKPGKSFTLSYTLLLRDLYSQNCFEQIVSAQLNPLSDSKTTTDLEPGNLADFIPEINMKFWAFPNDRSLPHLPKLLDKEWLIPYFKTQVLALQLSDSELISFVDIKIMHYLPGQSCMIRYTLGIANQFATLYEGIKKIILYGKNYHDDCGSQTYTIMQQVAEQSDHFASPLYYDANSNTLWQAHLPGEPFEWLPALAENPGIFHKVANCISEFHRCHIKVAGCFGYPEIDQQLNAAVKLSVKLDSRLGRSVKEIVFELSRVHGQIDWGHKVTKTPLHMDLKMGNLLIADDKAYLVDLDSVCLGEPLIDIGSFVANLYLNGLRVGSSITEIDESVGIFITKYQAAVDWVVDDIKLHWHIAAALIHEVLRRSLRQQEGDRLHHNETYIAISHRYLTICREGICHG